MFPIGTRVRILRKPGGDASPWPEVGTLGTVVVDPFNSPYDEVLPDHDSKSPDGSWPYASDEIEAVG